MNEPTNKKLIFLSAAEASADAHCAALIHSLAAKDPTIEFIGVGGPKMQAAGCNLIAETVGKAAMSYNAILEASRFYMLIRKIRKIFAQRKPDLVIVCDSPAFNFHVAKAAKAANSKTLFYVAPQLWAWGAWRLNKLKKCCDKLCCLLPFEPAWFAQRGLESEFVGNPLLDELGSDLTKYERSYADYTPNTANVLLLPGSRDAEINTLWKPMQEVAVKLRRQFSQINFTAVTLDNKKIELLRSNQILGFKCSYMTGSLCDIAISADYAIVASGSATLQLAGAGCPMTVMYQANKLVWKLVGQWLIKPKNLSLVNILANQRLVPEYMPYFNSVEPIAKETAALLADPSALAKLSKALIKLSQPLAGSLVSDRVAEIALKMI